MIFDAEGVRAKLENRIASAGPWFWLREDLAAALDRITELEAALAAAEGARLAAERGLAGEGA